VIRFTVRQGLEFGPMRVPTWKVLLTAATAATLLMTLALFSLALLLVLLPLVLVGLLVRRLRVGLTPRRPPTPPGVIEADYVVLSDRRLGRDTL